MVISNGVKLKQIKIQRRISRSPPGGLGLVIGLCYSSSSIITRYIVLKLLEIFN